MNEILRTSPFYLQRFIDNTIKGMNPHMKFLLKCYFKIINIMNIFEYEFFDGDGIMDVSKFVSLFKNGLG